MLLHILDVKSGRSALQFISSAAIVRARPVKVDVGHERIGRKRVKKPCRCVELTLSPTGEKILAVDQERSVMTAIAGATSPPKEPQYDILPLERDEKTGLPSRYARVPRGAGPDDD